MSGLAASSDMSSQTLNVILFGDTGVGKSSVINLMAGNDIAKTSSDASGCTMDCKDYQINLGSRQINLWDTVGLNEPTMGVNGYYDAIVKAYELIRKLSKAGGVDLLLLCIRGQRIPPSATTNYLLFYEILCNKQVPIALVITHLERENRMEDWWERNEATILGYGIRTCGHASVTGLPDEVQKYNESKLAMSCLLSHHDNSSRFSMPLESVFTRFLRWVTSFFSKGRPSVVDIANFLMKRCNFDLETAYRLAAQLVASRTAGAS